MFACLYLTYRYLDGLSMPSPYYSIPTQCVSDLLRPSVDFIYLRSYRHSDVLIIYSYGWLRYYYRFGLRSLRTISHIRSLRRHFDLSEVIFHLYFTYHSHYKQRITSYLIPSPFVRLRIASIWLTLRSTAFPDIILHTSTLTHCILPRYTAFFWLSFVLARVLSVSLWSRSIFCYLHRTTFTDIYSPLHSFIRSLLSRISTLLPSPSFTSVTAQEQILPELRTY
jgi:hypothetical protein